MVRPGLTGWAQVRYQYANNLEEEIEKLRYDLYYVKHASVWLDLRILVDTCRILFSGRLADGVGIDRPVVTPMPTVGRRPFRAPRKLNPTRAA
jgi:sugar transferase